ncbi:hypothetical protein A2U01_0050537 [Trifolium medium]|uniref:Uncharacterized protein n=1 Tax=Trifolium medium TaxID=97028 RepID=A0A392QYF0_9FABA|nr:hypothetical protein [Trifolium medium]
MEHRIVSFLDLADPSRVGEMPELEIGRHEWDHYANRKIVRSIEFCVPDPLNKYTKQWVHGPDL